MCLFFIIFLGVHGIVYKIEKYDINISPDC